MLMEKQITEVPQIEIPDEVTHTSQPEIIETTPHPQVPDPQARAFFFVSEGKSCRIFCFHFTREMVVYQLISNVHAVSKHRETNGFPTDRN